MKRSETISELAKALVKFNAKVGKISKDANNPFFKNKYATLDNIIDEVRPILSEFGLNIMQLPSGDGNKVDISTLLMHESGEWLESEVLTMIPVKKDPQGLGSAITYARRYALQSFLSLSTGEDDDGNGASQHSKPQQGKYTSNKYEKPVQPSKERITPNQLSKVLKLIDDMCLAKKLSKGEVLGTLQKSVCKFENLKDVTTGQAGAMIYRLEQGLKN